MRSPNKHIRTLHIAVILLGDILVFLGFVFLGKTEHGIIDSKALIRTALPFAVIWCCISPMLGAFKPSTIYNIKTTIWRIPLIWLLCGLVALFARALLTDRPLAPTFALVALAVQGALLVGWRGIFILGTRWVSSHGREI